MDDKIVFEFLPDGSVSVNVSDVKGKLPKKVSQKLFEISQDLTRFNNKGVNLSIKYFKNIRKFAVGADKKFKLKNIK